MNTSTNDTDNVIRVATVDYVSFLKLSYEGWTKLSTRFAANFSENYTFPSSFFDDVRNYCFLSWFDISSVLLMAVFWTYLRIYLTNSWFLPIATKLGVSQQNLKKVPESCWKFMFYSFAWSLSAYIVLLSGRYQYFWDPLSVWDGWQIGMTVPFDIQFAYLIQSSFYLHSIYGTIFMDVWRKDSIVMLAHHLLTIILIGFSFASRYHAIGSLVLLLHDISDVALELTKINVYLKHRHGKFRLEHDLISSFGFLSFAVSWFVFRLYWFPLKVLYAGLYGAASIAPHNIPFVPCFNGMLWILLAMNCYWFSFILILLVKVATGQAKEIDDTREFKENENGSSAKSKKLSKNGALKENSQNGVVHDKVQ